MPASLTCDDIWAFWHSAFPLCAAPADNKTTANTAAADSLSDCIVGFLGDLMGEDCSTSHRHKHDSPPLPPPLSLFVSKTAADRASPQFVRHAGKARPSVAEASRRPPKAPFRPPSKAGSGGSSSLDIDALDPDLVAALLKDTDGGSSGSSSQNAATKHPRHYTVAPESSSLVTRAKRGSDSSSSGGGGLLLQSKRALGAVANVFGQMLDVSVMAAEAVIGHLRRFLHALFSSD